MFRRCGRSVLAVAALLACGGTRPSQSTPSDAYALEPASAADLAAAIESARSSAERAGDVEGQKLLGDLATRSPTNALVDLANCVLVGDGTNGRSAIPIEPDSPCDNPDVDHGALVNCCRFPQPAQEACGYCKDAAREDPTLAPLAGKYGRRCEEKNARQEAAFDREAARVWVEWARSRDPSDRGMARSALGRARTAMDAARAVDGADDGALRREIMNAERDLPAVAP